MPSSALPPLERLVMAAGSAAVGLANPARADMVALLGDLTSGPALSRLVTRMQASASGREMLSRLEPSRFPSNGDKDVESWLTLPSGTLGHEYARFMKRRGFSTESRDPVRFVEDPAQRFVLQRYRDVHDVWHVLTRMPTTVLGELAQKWFEGVHTGLPVALLSAAVGPVRLHTAERLVLVQTLVPWALRCGRRCDDLMSVPYEEFIEEDVTRLRSMWNIEVVDVHMKGRKHMA